MRQPWRQFVLGLGLRLGKSPHEMATQFTPRDLAEYYALLVGPEKCDGRSGLERMLDKMAGLG
jgi:hypothetical protein